MEVDQTASFFNEIFYPVAQMKIVKAKKGRAQFAYYTTRETALKILENKELWLRNATLMNDYSEIRYGLSLIYSAFESRVGDQLSSAIDFIFEGVAEEVGQNIGKFSADWISETYIACLSEIDPQECLNGRLSMWRAYGDTAIVVKNTPLIRGRGESAVYTIPVEYPTNEEYLLSLQTFTDQVMDNHEALRNQGREWFVRNLTNMFFNTAVGTKHPGFAEEREWRLFYRNNVRKYDNIVAQTATINGKLQTVYVLKLEPQAELGLDESGLVNILDHVIIGPTAHPDKAQKQIVSVLSKSGYSKPATKVLASKIPLRQN